MIAYAAEKAVPPSVLLGRVVAPGEPLWTDLDLEQVLGYRRELSAACPTHGVQREAWYGPDGKTPLSPAPFEPVAVRWPCCEVTEQFRKQAVPDDALGVVVELAPYDPSAEDGDG